MGASVGIGTMKSTQETLQSRMVNSLGVRFFPGWSFGSVMVGALGQYRVIGQITGAAKVDNTNVGGHGYYAGGGAVILLGSALLQVSYDFLGNLSYFKKTASGYSQSIKDPMGVTASLGFKTWDRAWLDLFVSIHSFSTSSRNGNDVDIADNKVKESIFGLGISF
jgi:hypothetical protein